MIQAFQTAVSGLHASTQRLKVVAGNVANSRTEGYEPIKVVQSAEPGGGTRATLVAIPPLGSVPGLMPNVNLAEEFVEARRAVHAYRANLTVLSFAREMNGAVLDREE